MLFVLMVSMMLPEVSCQKGGAKAGMRRGGRGGSRGRNTMGRRNGDNDMGTLDIGGRSGKRACVGLCYLRSAFTWKIFCVTEIICNRKLQGKPPLPERKPRKPCIGMCYLKKIREMKNGK